MNIIVLTREFQGGVKKMTNEELIAKVDSGQGLTVTEIKRYQRLVKPHKHLYGKYGTLAKIYLAEHAVGKYWALVANGTLPDYLHGIDRQADELYDTISVKLQTKQYRRTGDYITDVRRIVAMQKAIKDEILTELVYVA